MKTKTLQEQYNLIKEGKGNKEIFLKEAKLQFPHLIRNAANFTETTTILKQRSIISENILQLGLVTQNKKQNWFDIFNQNLTEQNETNVKVDSNKVAKEVEDNLESNFDYEDKKNIDTVYGGAFLNGFYTEMQNPKNADKTIDELKAIVTKNLTKDRLYYTTQTQFGIEGIGYTDQIPGYKPSKELKGKYKSSGYGDLDIDVEKIKANTKDNLSKKEAKTKMPSGVKEMPVTPKTVSGVKKMDMPGSEKTIKLKEGIGMFNDPIGYKKSELSDLDKMFTKEYKGNGIYVIYKNGEEVKTIEGEGNANAWINGEMRKLKEALSSSQLSQYANMSDQEIIDWAKEDGMEDYIEYDGLGQLSNHDELLSYLLGKEVDDNDLDNDKEDMFGPGEFDPAGGRGLSSHLEESKKQSLKQSLKEKIKDIVKEILSEDNTLDEGAAEDKAAADAAKANATAQATAAQAAAKAATAAAAAAKKKEADVKADKNPGIPGAGA